MATHTTQDIWYDIATLANENLKFQKPINPKPSFFTHHPYAPVEQVTYLEVREWIDALNKLSAQGQPELTNLIDGHKNGDIYRLPSVNEFEYVLRNQGLVTTENLPFKDDSTTIDAHTWNINNSGGRTHMVADKMPIIVNGKKFFDLFGNVRHFTDTQVLAENANRVLKGYVAAQGTSFASLSEKIGFSSVDAVPVNIRSRHIGFRLVRNIRE